MYCGCGDAGPDVPLLDFARKKRRATTDHDRTMEESGLPAPPPRNAEETKTPAPPPRNAEETPAPPPKDECGPPRAIAERNTLSAELGE